MPTSEPMEVFVPQYVQGFYSLPNGTVVPYDPKAFVTEATAQQIFEYYKQLRPKVTFLLEAYARHSGPFTTPTVDYYISFGRGVKLMCANIARVLERPMPWTATMLGMEVDFYA